MALLDITTFLAWCTLINFGLLIGATLALVGFRGSVSSIHGAIFGIPKDELSKLYFLYLVVYKLLIIVFNLVPYLVLRLIIA
ncbi:MAG: DUF6868 family protein [Pseudomonadota bacterium]